MIFHKRGDAFVYRTPCFMRRTEITDRFLKKRDTNFQNVFLAVASFFVFIFESVCPVCNNIFTVYISKMFKGRIFETSMAGTHRDSCGRLRTVIFLRTQY